MIVYQATKAAFCEDVLLDRIESKILQCFSSSIRSSTSKGELQSWKSSMLYMDKVLADQDIPDSCGVSIEFEIPGSGKRIDFVLTGMSEERRETALIVELKQWSTALISDKDAVVSSFVGGRVRELTHPSYQAWSYAALLENFNEVVSSGGVDLWPCAYLHNYQEDEVIRNVHYAYHLDRAPVFLRGEAVELRDFIKRYIKYGDDAKLMFRIDQGRFKPSKMLADSMASMLDGNVEFVMIDEQKLVYEQALKLSVSATVKNKKVLVVNGGPGTGKSVVAVNLLVELIKRGLLAKYVSKNAAPRAVYERMLTGSLKKTVISSLFGGSGAYVEAKENLFDVLIVDEAHRLNEKSGLYSNLGVNQIKELIDAAQCVVFFLDERQKVHINDIGSKENIDRWANLAGAQVSEMELSSQFRCGGSDGYLAWLDEVLQIRETANKTLQGIDYDFRVFDDPQEMRRVIVEKNSVNNKSRMVAGYCWDWRSKRNSLVNDIEFPEFGFGMQWNLASDGSLFIIGEDSVNQIGCIHTCQGLELDYVGVVIGEDLMMVDGVLVTRADRRSKSDKSVFGYKKKMLQDPVGTALVLEEIIKNTYRTLMTRGMKGCFVYCRDKALGDYFSKAIGEVALG